MSGCVIIVSASSDAYPFVSVRESCLTAMTGKQPGMIGSLAESLEHRWTHRRY